MDFSNEWNEDSKSSKHMSCSVEKEIDCNVETGAHNNRSTKTITENKLHRHRRITYTAIILLLRFVAVYCLYRALMACIQARRRKSANLSTKVTFVCLFICLLNYEQQEQNARMYTNMGPQTHTHTHYTYLLVVHIAKNRSNCIVLTVARYKYIDKKENWKKEHIQQCNNLIS